MATSPTKLKLDSKQESGSSHLFYSSIKNPKNSRHRRRNIVESILRLDQSAVSNKFKTVLQSPLPKLEEQQLTCVESEYRHTNLRR